MSTHAKQVLAVLVMFAGICLAAFVAWRASVKQLPERVVTQEVQVEVEKIVYQDRIVEKVVYQQAVKAKTRKTRVVVTAPDGTKTDTTLVDNTTDTDTKIDQEKTKEVKVFVDRVVEREVRVEVKANQPDWRVSALVGANAPLYPGLLSGDQFDPLKHITYGVHVERRILGPFSLGRFGLTTGQVGVSAGLEF